MIEHLAAQLAPEIDRVALCIHRPSGQRPEFRQVVRGLQLPAGTIVVTAARHLAAGRVTIQDLELLARYESRTVVALNAQHHVERGFLSSDGDGGFVSSVPFRAAAQLALSLQAEAAAELWGAQADHLEELVQVACRFVDAAGRGSPVPTPAFDSQVALHHVAPVTAAGQLLARVTELRYLRADLHSAALGRHDLAGPRARTLARGWNGQEISDDHGTALAKRGLVVRTSGGWALADAARSIRDEVEADTNALVAATLRRVDVADWESLLRGLLRLDGEDPRPPEDR